MSSWNDLLDELNSISAQDIQAREAWYVEQMKKRLGVISQKRGGTNTIVYASAFLQKPGAPFAAIAITSEDINGLMSALYKTDPERGLTLVMHTPGGDPNAAETMVSYLRSRFKRIEVIIPAIAMSAGTMVSLGCDEIIMGRQSQLGPIDPQVSVDGKTVSADSILRQFQEAERAIKGDPRLSSLYYPFLHAMAPSLVHECKNHVDYGRKMVERLLRSYMLKQLPGKKRAAQARKIAAHFSNVSKHKSHGRRIDRDEARKVGLTVTDLESSQELQDAVLSAYHVITIGFEQTPVSKVITSDAGRTWIKHVA